MNKSHTHTPNEGRNERIHFNESGRFVLRLKAVDEPRNGKRFVVIAKEKKGIESERRPSRDPIADSESYDGRNNSEISDQRIFGGR